MAVRRYRVAVLGGTFDRLHVGHLDLLDAALAHGKSVGVGVTTDGYLRAHPKLLGSKIQSYRTRVGAVTRYLRTARPGASWWTAPLDDGWGRSIEPGVDLLVATEDTAAGAAAVNAERARRGLPSLELLVVPMRRGDDLLPVSSRRIRAGSIDAAGHRRRPTVIGVVGVERQDRAALARALDTALPGARAKPTYPGPSLGSVATLVRAENEAQRRARRALRNAEYGIGLVAIRPRRTSAIPPGPRPWMMSIVDAQGEVAPPILTLGGSFDAPLKAAFGPRRRVRPASSRRS